MAEEQSILVGTMSLKISTRQLSIFKRPYKVLDIIQMIMMKSKQQ